MLRNMEAERARLGLSKKDIASELGVTAETYAAYASGKHAIPSNILLKLVDMFGCSADYLLGLRDERGE